VKYAGLILGIIGAVYAGYKYYGEINIRRSRQEHPRTNPIINLVEYNN
jgi:hypothetical protein